MRKHLHLIISDEEDDDLTGTIAATDTQSPSVEKNTETTKWMRNWETDERWHRVVVGMGYVDFEEEDEFHDTERYGKVVQRKLGEIDAEYLDKAGIDPEEAVR